ncbi:hypothetical protein [Pseudarthrobacter sp. MEB009]|uniref:hypothetical protein n=1 Tax=Pseudarthrobacter sp. MEB009 TaxID=3040326 RepID=UPI00255250AF|nr:hypothetical protein [Pseudarthrobacter sp. MEB009]
MTPTDLAAEQYRAEQETLHYRGLTAQAKLIGLTAQADTYGQPACNTHLIAKLRQMNPEQLATIRGQGNDTQTGTE